MDASTPDSQFPEFNLDPALAETVETASPEQIGEGILRLENPTEVPPLFSVVSRFNRICTGRFRADHAWAIRRHANVISLKAARPLGVSYDGEDLTALDLPGTTGIPPRSPSPFGGRGCIVAALDFGLDFAHPNFLNPDGTTRLVSFWHQGATYDAAHANRYSYGRVFSREEINAALRESDPYQALGYHPAISDTGSGSHGTHTLDIAAGNGRARGARAAAAWNADLMFIHLSTPRLGFVGDLGDSVRMLEALDYVDRTARGRPWVVNLSVGRTAGSHDGTSLVEQGMHELLRLGPGRAIVQSAGNYRSANLAVEGWLRDGEHRDLQWIIDPDDTTDNEIDVWYSGKDRFVIAIRPPQGQAFVEVKLGDVADIVHEGAVVGRLYHRRMDPNNRDNHAEVFLYPGAPAGVWTFRMIGEYVISGRFHAWIERDLARPGAQSRFDARITSQSYTLGTIATSPLVITVGAYDANSEGTPLARFSSCGPTRDERRDKPELLAPGVAVVAARSIPRDALREEGLLVARSGTSMATPHVTGTVAAMFEAAGRPVSIDEIRDCLRRSAEPFTDAENAGCCGWGRLNVAGAIREIQGARAVDPVSPPRENLFAPYPQAVMFDSTFDSTFDDAAESFAGTPEIEAPSEEGEFMNLDGISRALEQAEQAADNIGGGRRQSETWFLRELLRELDDRISVLGLSPAELFRAVLYNGPLMQDARKVLEVLAMPSQRPESALRPGDWMLRAVPATGDVGHISVLTSGELLTQSMVASEGISAEGMQPGYYGLVIEAGAFPHSRARPFARRVLDSRSRVPPHTVVLRPRYSDLGVVTDYPPYEPYVDAVAPAVGTGVGRDALLNSGVYGASEAEPPNLIDRCKSRWDKLVGSLSDQVRQALKREAWNDAVILAIHGGIRDLKTLTGLVFHSKYGSKRGYCDLTRGPADTNYRSAWNYEENGVRPLLALPTPPKVQKGGIQCRKIERALAPADPDISPQNITGRYEYRDDRNRPMFTVNINQAGNHIEGFWTDVLYRSYSSKTRRADHFRGDRQSDGRFLFFSARSPDYLWGYLKYENANLYVTRMGASKDQDVKLVKCSHTATLTEMAFTKFGFPERGIVHSYERFPLTQKQIERLRNMLSPAMIEPLLTNFFTFDTGVRYSDRDKHAKTAQPLLAHLEKVFEDQNNGFALFDWSLARFYARSILASTKWNFEHITRTHLDWIQLMLDIVKQSGFNLAPLQTYLGLSPSNEIADKSAPQHEYKVSLKLKGFSLLFARYKGELTIEKISGKRWRPETFKAKFMGGGIDFGTSFEVEGKASTYLPWSSSNVPGDAKLGELGISIGASASAGFLQLFGTGYLPPMDVTFADVDLKGKVQWPRAGGKSLPFGEILKKNQPDVDLSSNPISTDYGAQYKLLNDVHFCLGSAFLTDDGRQALRIVGANELVAFRSSTSSLRIVGHTDRVDTTKKSKTEAEKQEKNRILSKLRAENTLKAIIDILGRDLAIPDNKTQRVTEGQGEEEAIREEKLKKLSYNNKPIPKFRRVDVYLNSRLIISLQAL